MTVEPRTWSELRVDGDIPELPYDGDGGRVHYVDHGPRTHYLREVDGDVFVRYDITDSGDKLWIPCDDILGTIDPIPSTF